MATFSTDNFFYIWILGGIQQRSIAYSGFLEVPCFQRGLLSEVKRLKRYVGYQ